MISKIKSNERGVEIKYTTRIQAKRFVQNGSVDFGETIDPTSRFETFRLLLALIAQHNLHLEHSDVKSAFLHAKIKKKCSLNNERF